MMSLSMVSELIRNLIRKPVTRKYPFEKREIPKRFRGRIKIDYKNCIGCGLCARFCPPLAIEMVVIKREGRRIIRRPKVNIYRCIFCGQCMLICPKKVISFDKDYELATYNKESLVLVPKEGCEK